MWLRFAKNITSGKNEILVILQDKSRLQDVYEISHIPKIQPVVAFFLNQGETVVNLIDMSNKLSVILEKKPIELQVSKTGVRFGDKSYNNFLGFSEAIHGLYSLFNPKQETKINEDDLNEVQKVKNGRIEVKKINSADEARMYGSDQSWCIAQYGSTYWQSYRDTKESTFYFVFDGTRPMGDPLRKVAVDVNKNGVELTDENNTTGDISEFGTDWRKYFAYLKSKGIDTSQFVANPKTEQELIEHNLLGYKNKDLNWFQNLSYDHKSKYIGRGHELTNKQFDYLYNNKAYDLLNQYLNTGIPVNSYQESKLSGQLKKTYDRKIDQFIEEIKKHPEWFFYGGLEYARGNINFIRKLHQNNLLEDFEPDVFIQNCKDDAAELIELGYINGDDLIKNAYDLTKQGLIKFIKKYDIPIEELAHHYDYYMPQNTIDLLELGCDPKVLFNPLKQRSTMWTVSLDENHIQTFIEKYHINISALVSVLDSRISSTMFYTLLNKGADINQLLEKTLGNFNEDEVKTLIQNYGVDPNYFVTKQWDLGDIQRTLFLMKLGADPLYRSLENLTLNHIQRGLNNGSITDLNRLVTFWRPAPWDSIEVLKMGADPQTVLNTGLNTMYWMDKMRPDLVEEFLKYGIDINKIKNKLDEFDSTGEIDLGYATLDQQASFNFKKYLRQG